ncbi:hypothetical protein SAMN05444745_103108 [Arthrobacter sp. OV608]|nr:hypothetical protein SAMN05444745_103108 [Arthrobacter sp. OV608]
MGTSRTRPPPAMSRLVLHYCTPICSVSPIVYGAYCQRAGVLANNCAEDEAQKIGNRGGAQADRELPQAPGQG